MKNLRVYILFLFCLVYWVYLAQNSEMVQTMDAAGYVARAQMISEGGFQEYLKHGPEKEPLYPLSLVLSMTLASRWNIPFDVIQKTMQLGWLFLAQVLLWKILRRLDIRPVISLLIAGYMGVSPAILNSALSLFTEIMTYPMTLAIVLVGVELLIRINKDNVRSIVLWSLGFAVVFIIAISVKYTYLTLVPVFWFLFFCLIVQGLWHKNKILLRNVLIVIPLFCVPLFGFDHYYKSLNQSIHGAYTFTGGGGRSLYGGTMVKTRPINTREALTGFAMVPGKGVCDKLFSDKECTQWSFLEADMVGALERERLYGQGYSTDKVDQTLVLESIEEIGKHPLQFTVFYIAEFWKMFFFESTNVGFVNYPPWLTALYTHPLIKNGIRLFTALWAMTAFIYVMAYVIRKRGRFLNYQEPKFVHYHIVLLSVSFITIFGCIVALFSVLTRYSFPVAPLQLINIAFLLQYFGHDRKKSTRR